MDGIAAELLKVCGPLTVFAAQAVYLSQPLIRGLIAENNLIALAELLEDDSQKNAFITILQEDSPT